MKVQNIRKSGFRSLSNEEVSAVSGGVIVVTGNPRPPLLSGIELGNILGLIDDYYDGIVDTGYEGGGSGDNEIVVTGDKIDADCEEHRQAAEDALDALYEGSDLARNLIDIIRANGVTISTGTFNDSGAGQQAGFDLSTNTIHWDPFQAVKGINSDGSTYTLSPFMILAHELIHAANADNPDFQTHASEPIVIPLANQIAAQFNAANGTNYDTSRDSHLRDMLFHAVSTFSEFFSITDHSCND